MNIELDEKELILIWFSLTMEQSVHEKGSQLWAKYEGTIRKIEAKLGTGWITPRPTLKVVK
jgi:hypothetical protein